MKNQIALAILFLLLGINAQGQKQEKYFYDKSWIVLKSDSGAEYYRLFNVDDCGNPIGKVYDYYITGELQAEIEGAIRIDKMIDANSKFFGKTIGYYRSGKNYFKSLRDSNNVIISQTGWYENGNLDWELKRNGTIETIVYYYFDGNLETQADRFKVELKVIKALRKEAHHNLMFKHITSKPTFSVGAMYKFASYKYVNGNKIGGPYCGFEIFTDFSLVEKVCTMNEKEIEEKLYGMLWK